MFRMICLSFDSSRYRLLVSEGDVWLTPKSFYPQMFDAPLTAELST